MSQVQITFRHVPPSEVLRDLAEEKFAKLRRQLGAPASCHVVIDRPALAPTKSACAHVHVQVRGAGIQLDTEASDTDLGIALRGAFERALAQVKRTNESPRASRSRRRERAVRARPMAL